MYKEHEDECKTRECLESLTHSSARRAHSRNENCKLKIIQSLYKTCKWNNFEYIYFVNNVNTSRTNTLRLPSSIHGQNASRNYRRTCIYALIFALFQEKNQFQYFHIFISHFVHTSFAPSKLIDFSFASFDPSIRIFQVLEHFQHVVFHQTAQPSHRLHSDKSYPSKYRHTVTGICNFINRNRPTWNSTIIYHEVHQSVFMHDEMHCQRTLNITSKKCSAVLMHVQRVQHM